jgi:multiple sugar transport system permease protein
MKDRTLTNKIRPILLFIFGLLMLFPFVWMLSTSIKQGREVYSLSLWVSNPSLDNYTRLFTNSYFPRWFINSFIAGTIVTCSILFFDSLMGYTFAKHNFRGKKLIFILVLSTMMIPTEMLIIPWYLISSKAGWVDTYWGIVFPGLMTGFGTFLMRQFFDTLPDDLFDAGRIDGMNEFSIWVQIGMPLVKAALSALAIFSFVGNWNAFLWPLIISSATKMYTLPVGLALFNGEFSTEWEMIMTGASVATIPVIIIYIIFQRQIIEGIALTGVKG